MAADHITDCARKPIPGFEGFYEVDALGNVFSLPRQVPTHLGYRTTVSGRQLAGTVDRYGYRVFTLHRDNRPFTIGGHRLVCMAFHGPPPAKAMQAAHDDGDKLNNTPSNLRWATPAENNEDRRRHGAHPVGERLPHAKLTACKALEIVSRSSAGISDRSLARTFGVSNTAIRKVRTGRSWGHVTGITRTLEIEAEIARLNQEASV